MRRTSVALRALAVIVVVALPVAADAPLSGPDRQYANFTSQDPTIRDLFTHLVWERPPSDAPYPAPVAFKDVNCRSSSMRLPTVKELLTLVDEQPHEVYIGTANVTRYIDKNAFAKTPGGTAFWTSTIVDGQVATVDFETGEVDFDKQTDLRYVRCVDYVP